MSDFWAIKRLDGCPAILLRFAGPDYVVVEVNRKEQLLSRKIWADLPTDCAYSKPSVEHAPIGGFVSRPD
jgi:hypothetical protein